MEINKVTKATPVSNKDKPEAPTSSIAFTEVMAQRRDQLDLAKFNKLAAKIEDQGKILAQSRTVEDLRHYKSLVKSFMEEAVKHALRVDEKRGFNRRGKAKIYKIVTKVDEKLLELTDHVLGSQANSLKILSLIGEIKGLLVDIYS
ncbi:YaaR family protein [Heliophilum fasciatum]|uniref:DUF327 family protein n=1 Tax=Heliophilum fasciatum TaxID=35700 RepID=A0A4R2RKM9_9FIRM|nr:YaaR family protein [Heliophilum fasciatum]MCW2279461.1 uncharacterized protein YaaR (DUF327 family) [Heliophilum fasciatum]TCP59785.1 hypothetical protein EDD73_1483 [Heliophilum fasciatum]